MICLDVVYAHKTTGDLVVLSPLYQWGVTQKTFTMSFIWELILVQHEKPSAFEMDNGRKKRIISVEWSNKYLEFVGAF